MPRNRKKITVILGAPKSGISPLAECFRLSGCTIIGAQNNSTIKDPAQVNRLFLQNFQSTSSMVGMLPEDWNSSEAVAKIKKRIRSLLYGYDGDPGPLVIADPLLCRVLPIWLAAFSELSFEPQFIHIVRHPWEMAISRVQVAKLGLLKCHLLWLAFNREAFTGSSGYSRTIVTFGQLIADPVSTLISIRNTLDIEFPKNLRTTYPIILNYIHPKLKHHHAGDASKRDRNKFRPFTQIYDALRITQVKPDSLMGNEGFETLKKDPGDKGLFINPNASSITSEIASIFHDGLMDLMFQAIGEYEMEEHERSLRKHKIRRVAKDDRCLFAQVVFPSTNDSDKVVETTPLIANEWQRIALPVPEPALLRDKQLILKPLNTNGTVKISALKLVNVATSEGLWTAQTPQDFEALELDGTVLRMPDMDNLVLVVTGDKPRLRLPVIGKLPDCPIEIEIWIRVSREQEILHRKIGHRKSTQKGSSNLVWLASYPRSGNTLLRIILNHNFGLKSYSIYNDNNDIGKYLDVAEEVGHEFMNWSFLEEQNITELKPESFSRFDSMRYKTKTLKLVKTHCPYHDGFAPDKVIYICRDGRAALRSYASYKEKFNKKERPLDKLFDELLCDCDNLFGPWSEHIFSWMKHPQDKILFLKFEDIVSDFDKTLKKIAKFLELDPIRTDVLSFDHLHSINADFFRKGKKKSWQDMFNDTRHALFWIVNHEAMFALGYDKDQHPICDMLNKSSQEREAFTQNRCYPNKVLIEFNRVLKECVGLFSKHVDKMPDDNKLLIGKQLRNTYSQILSFFKSHASERIALEWTEKWDSFINDKILN